MISTEVAIQNGVIHKWDHFLSEDACRDLVAKLSLSRKEPSVITRFCTEQSIQNRAIRSSYEIQVCAGVSNQIGVAIKAMMPALKIRFGHQLGASIQPLRFLCYENGNFFKRHSDSGRSDRYPKFIQERKITLILFLNGQMPVGGLGFQGGDFIIYVGETAHNISQKEGTLLAFRSELDHEVKPVTAGNRYSIVAWIC